MAHKWVLMRLETACGCTKEWMARQSGLVDQWRVLVNRPATIHYEDKQFKLVENELIVRTFELHSEEYDEHRNVWVWTFREKLPT